MPAFSKPVMLLSLSSPPAATTPSDTAIDGWGTFDAELANYLRERTSRRATRSGREASALDGMAMSLRRVRVTLESISSTPSAHDDTVKALVSRCYRWTIRMARELDTIEALDLDPIREWARFEVFAPFARAFFESALSGPFDVATRTADVARLRRDIDGVMAPIRIALMSSAVAA